MERKRIRGYLNYQKAKGLQAMQVSERSKGSMRNAISRWLYKLGLKRRRWRSTFGFCRAFSQRIRLVFLGDGGELFEYLLQGWPSNGFTEEVVHS